MNEEAKQLEQLLTRAEMAESVSRQQSNDIDRMNDELVALRAENAALLAKIEKMEGCIRETIECLEGGNVHDGCVKYLKEVLIANPPRPHNPDQGEMR